MMETRNNNLLRMHFNRRGKPKLAMSREQAWAKANRAHMKAYHCSFCDAWHVGGR